MVEINQILRRMVTAIKTPEFPASSAIASALGLDLSKAKITMTNRGVVSIVGASLATWTVDVGVIGGSMPRRTLDLAFVDSTIPVRPFVDAPPSVDQRIEQSKHDKGLAIAFTIDGFDCGITASAKDGVVETLFCSAPAKVANS
jgi:hypothetical protein